MDETIDQVTNSETAKQATEFVKEQTQKASEVLDQVSDDVQKCNLWQKIKAWLKH